MAVGNLESVQLAWIQAFGLVYEHGSESAAARKIKCDQSTISRYVKHLGAFLGGELFEAESPGKLTPLGIAFYPKAEELVGWMWQCKGMGSKIAATKVGAQPAAAPKAKAWLWLKRFGLS